MTSYYVHRPARRHDSQKPSQSVSIGSLTQWLAMVWASNQFPLRPAFIFAHPDDASLSAFLALVETGPRALDIVVCAGRPQTQKPGTWDRQSGFFSSHDAWTRRLAEHNAVNRMIGANSVTLNLIDGQYENMAAELWHQAQLRAIAHMQSAGSNVVITHGWKSVHPDHRRVAALAHGAANELQIPVVFTCDRPYFSRAAERINSPSINQSMSITCSFLLPTHIWVLKMATIALYKSQHVALSAAFGPEWCDEMHLRFESYTVILRNCQQI